MARIREVPPAPMLDSAPRRLRFEEYDRILLDDGVDWRWEEDDERGKGHILRAAHDAKIRRSISFEQMWMQSRKMDFRHDRGWYSKREVKKRLRADVASLVDLTYRERQYIYWQEALCLEFLRLEANDPGITRGEVSFETEKTIGRICATVATRVEAAADDGRRKRTDRVHEVFGKPDRKTLLRWIKMLVGADFDPTVFCKRFRRSGNREERLTQEQCLIAGKYAMLYCSPTEPSVRELHAKIETEIARINRARKKANAKSRKKLPLLGQVSYDRLARQIALMDAFEKMAGRKGMGAALKAFRPVGDGLPDVLRPVQHVEIDHWTVQLQTLLIWSGQWDGLTKKSQSVVRDNAKRMVLGIAICRRTHCILAMVLSRTPSVASAIRLLEMAVTDKQAFADGVGALTPWDVAGTMETLVMDGGPAFNNAEFRSRIAALGVIPEMPPGGLPHLRGLVERMFRNIEQKLVMQFEGRTFANVVAKGDYDSVGRAGITIDELSYALIRYVVDVYHNTQQGALGGETPRACFLRLAKENGITPRPDSHLLRNVFGVEIDRKLSPAGVRFLGIQYRSRALHAHFMKVKNAAVKVKAYPGNIGAISVMIGRSYLTVKAPPEFENVDAKTWIGAEALLRRRGAHYKKITRDAVVDALTEFDRLSAVGRRRADIGDVPVSRSALLHAERSIAIFVNYPDEAKNVATDGVAEGLYVDTVKVGSASARKAPSPERHRVRKAGSQSAKAPAKSGGRTSAKAPHALGKARMPKKKALIGKSRIPGRNRVIERPAKVTG